MTLLHQLRELIITLRIVRGLKKLQKGTKKHG